MTTNLTPIGHDHNGDIESWRMREQHVRLYGDADGFVRYEIVSTDPELVPLPALTPLEEHADEQASGNDRSIWPYTAGARARVAAFAVAWGEMAHTPERIAFTPAEAEHDGAELTLSDLRVVLSAARAAEDTPEPVTYDRILAVVEGAWTVDSESDEDGTRWSHEVITEAVCDLLGIPVPVPEYDAAPTTPVEG